MRKKRTLIHFALLTEAKPFIGSLKLSKLQNGIYENDAILLVIGGIGYEKTKTFLQTVFCEYTFERAINIGMAGCVDERIPIGSLFCTNQDLKDIPRTTLSSFEAPVTCKKNISTTLVDMEAKSFEDVVKKYLHVKNIFIFKIVSDYLSETIPTKEFVTNLMQKNIKKINQYVQ